MEMIIAEVNGTDLSTSLHCLLDEDPALGEIMGEVGG
jgi:hypothetical protein